jgi:uncharacterized protein HemX
MFDESGGKSSIWNLVLGGIGTVGQTVSTIVSSNNAVTLAQTEVEKEREKANLAKEIAATKAKMTKAISILVFSAIAIGLVLVGIVKWSKKPKYFQVGQSMQTYTLSGIHTPKIA